MGLRRLPTAVLGLLLLATSALFLALPAGATSVPASIGEWDVASSETYDSGTAAVNGNITVRAGATLTLSNVILEMNAAVDDGLAIRVQNGGAVDFTDVTLRAKTGASAYVIILESGASATFTRTSFRDVGSDVTMTGFLVQADGVLFASSTIWASSALVVAKGSVTLDHSTISGNRLFGVIAQSNAVLTINDTMITSTKLGSGLIITGSTATVTNSTVLGNPTGITARDSTLTIDDTTVRTSQGHGIQLVNVTASLTDAVLDNNTGAGVSAVESKVSILRTTVRDNGLGVALQQSAMTADQSTILRSTGAGLTVVDSTATMVDSELPGSDALRIDGDAQTTRSVVDLTNTILGNVTIDEPSSRSTVRVSWPVTVEISRQSGLPLDAAKLAVVTTDGQTVIDTTTDGTEAFVLEAYTLRRGQTDWSSPYSFTAQDGDRLASVVQATDSPTDVQLAIDDVPPVLTVTSPVNGPPTTASTVQVIGRVTGATEVTVNDLVVVADGMGAFTASIPVAEGLTMLVITAEDDAGNLVKVERSVIRDSTAPVLIFSPEPGLITRAASIELDGVTEPGALLSINGAPVTVADDGRFTSTLTLAEGLNSFAVAVRDPLGNSRTKLLSIVKDTKLPSLTVDEPLGFARLDHQQITVRGSTEPGAIVTIDTGSGAMNVPVIAGLFSVPLMLPEGDTTITVISTDAAGNWEVKAPKVTVDLTAPALTVTSPVDGKAVNTPLLTVVGLTEPGATVRVNNARASMDGTSFTAAVNLAEGRNTVRVTSTDLVGHVTVKDLAVVLDTSPPALSVQVPADGTRTNIPFVELAGRTTGARVTVNGQQQKLEPVTGESFFSTTVDISEGANSLTVVAWDGVGNSATIVRAVTLDTTVFLLVVGVPSKTSSATQLVAGFTDPGAIVTVNGHPTSADASGNFAITVAVPKGKSFITVSSRDDLGNIQQQNLPIERSVPAIAVPLIVALGPGALLIGLLFSAVGLAVRQYEPAKYWFFGVLAVPLYTQFRKSSVLDHYARGQIHGYIVANPGDHYNSIKEALKLNNGTLAHHLRILEKEGIVRSRLDGVYKRFYPYNMKIPQQNRARLSEVQKIILRRIKETPGISQKDVAALVGLSASTINYHIGILETKQLVRSERAGMRIGYTLTGDFDPEYPPAPPGMEDE